MMAEIYARGPIAATIAVPAALETWSGHGVFNDTTGALVGRLSLSLLAACREGGIRGRYLGGGVGAA